MVRSLCTVWLTRSLLFALLHASLLVLFYSEVGVVESKRTREWIGSPLSTVLFTSAPSRVHFSTPNIFPRLHTLHTPSTPLHRPNATIRYRFHRLPLEISPSQTQPFQQRPSPLRQRPQNARHLRIRTGRPRIKTPFKYGCPSTAGTRDVDVTTPCNSLRICASSDISHSTTVPIVHVSLQIFAFTISEVLIKRRQFSTISFQTLSTCSTITYLSNGLCYFEIVPVVLELSPIDSKAVPIPVSYDFRTISSYRL